MRNTQAITDTSIIYFQLIKPRETLLLSFIGICSALIASNGYLPAYKLVSIVIALIFGSAGCNGLTNYLDREIDGKMPRTRNRVLPQRSIDPPEKSFYLIVPLILIALVLTWILHPLCFILGLVGILASSLWRKTISCTFFGIVAGCSPVLIGWFSINPSFTLPIFMICLLVAFWIPIHVWSVLLAKREEYILAGLHYFPINLGAKKIIIIVNVLTCLLFILSVTLFLLHLFSMAYLVTVIVLGSIMLISTVNLLLQTSSKLAWRVYKISSFPYLGIIFVIMVLDRLL